MVETAAAAAAVAAAEATKAEVETQADTNQEVVVAATKVEEVCPEAAVAAAISRETATNKIMVQVGATEAVIEAAIEALSEAAEAATEEVIEEEEEEAILQETTTQKKKGLQTGAEVPLKMLDPHLHSPAEGAEVDMLQVVKEEVINLLVTLDQRPQALQVAMHQWL